jgi:hypothetical protein
LAPILESPSAFALWATFPGQDPLGATSNAKHSPMCSRGGGATAWPHVAAVACSAE